MFSEDKSIAHILKSDLFVSAFTVEELEEVPTPRPFFVGDASEELVEVLPGEVMGQVDWNEDEQVAKTNVQEFWKNSKIFIYFFFKKPKY